MPKKYKKNYKSRRSSEPSKHTGRKILIGLLAAGVIAGIIATALHYSFENDKRVPSPSSPLPPASSIIPSAPAISKRVTKAGPTFDPSLQLTDLVNGDRIVNTDVTVNPLDKDGARGYSINIYSFVPDNVVRHADLSGVYLYHFSFENGNFTDILESDESGKYHYSIDIQTSANDQEQSQLFLYNAAHGEFDTVNPFVAAGYPLFDLSGYDFGNINNENYTNNPPDFYLATKSAIEDITINMGSILWPLMDKNECQAVQSDLWEYSTGIKGDWATHSYSKKATYPSGVFSTGGERELFVELSGAPTLEQIVAQIKVEDYSGATLEVLSSDYDKNISGDYSIELKATDPIGNISTLTLIVKLRDYQPKLRAKTGNSTNITIGYSRLKNWDMITNLFEAFDYNDQPLAVGVKNSDGLKFSRVGLYHPILSTQDKAGRESTITLTINVVDDLPPVFLFSDALCYVSKDKPLNVAQIKAMILLSKGLSEVEVNEVELYENTYSEAANKAGTYSIGYKVIKISGESIIGTMSMIVTDDALAAGKRSPWTKFWDTVTTGWTEFWIRLGNLIRFRGWKL